jgi:hypothetical protein
LITRRPETHGGVVLLGPRQVGKTTLARAIAAKLKSGALYLDLERPVDRRRLDDADTFLRAQPLNQSRLASSFAVSTPAVGRYVDLLLVRRLLLSRVRPSTPANFAACKLLASGGPGGGGDGYPGWLYDFGYGARERCGGTLAVTKPYNAASKFPSTFASSGLTKW